MVRLVIKFMVKSITVMVGVICLVCYPINVLYEWPFSMKHYNASILFSIYILYIVISTVLFSLFFILTTANDRLHNFFN